MNKADTIDQINQMILATTLQMFTYNNYVKQIGDSIKLRFLLPDYLVCDNGDTFFYSDLNYGEIIQIFKEVFYFAKNFRVYCIDENGKILFDNREIL